MTLRPLLYAAALTAFFALLPLTAHSQVDPLDENATRSLESAITSMDEGETDVAIAMLEALLEKYPDNYSVRYELAYAHHLAEDHQKTIDIASPLTEHPDASPVVFTLLGNCYDILLRPDEALDIYDRGIKRFPESGLLYLNKGICLELKQKLTEALTEYENAIEADPTFDSPYYRAARLYALSSMPMWTLIYAETFNIISNRIDRKEEMANLIVDLLKDKISVDGKKISIKLVSDTVYVPDHSKLPFETIYEMGYALGAAAILNGWTLETVGQLRSDALTATTGALTPTNRMALQKFQKAIMDAGHWEAYNFHILRYAFADEAKQWLSDPENVRKLYDLTDFLKDYKEPFIDEEHTVSSRLIYK